jgi:hypothetical protein
VIAAFLRRYAAARAKRTAERERSFVAAIPTYAQHLDPEAAACLKVAIALQGLDARAQERVVRWAVQRWVLDAELARQQATAEKPYIQPLARLVQ